MPNFHRPSPLLSLLPLLLPVLLFLLGAPTPASSAPLLLDEEHVAATIFTVLYDGDDDGALSVAADGADVASFAAHLGFTPRNVLKVWRRLDLDGDGAISVDELVAGPPASQPKAKALHERLTATIAQSWAKNLPIERVLAILGHTDGDMGDARAHVRVAREHRGGDEGGTRARTSVVVAGSPTSEFFSRVLHRENVVITALIH